VKLAVNARNCCFDCDWERKPFHPHEDAGLAWSPGYARQFVCKLIAICGDQCCWRRSPPDFRFAGFIWFALRAPNDETTSRWRPVELILPLVAIVLAGLLTLSYANLLGYPTEVLTRAGVLSGIFVATCAFLILLARQRELPPQDYQRLRWVWGCLIGLPALVFADAGTTTTLLNNLWPGYSPPEQFWGLLYLVNGVLCLLVSEAVRRPYVVKVSIPLRRVTILGILNQMFVPEAQFRGPVDYLV
jgi:hypothetical protein